MKIGEVDLKELEAFLHSSGLKIYHFISSKNSAHFEFDILAKPGSKKENIVISKDGVLTIKTSGRAIEGEANAAIVVAVATVFGVPKSNVEIIRGDKSKNKRIKLLVEITANKNSEFYQQKISAILMDSV